MNIPPPLDTGNTALVVIDIQEKLFAVMHEREKLLNNVIKLIKGILALEIPVVLTEQYPKGLGPTVPGIKSLLPGIKPLEKLCFNCCDEEQFCRSLETLKRQQVLLAGIEAHICVYQTGLALARAGYRVQVVSDCVASRAPEDRAVALWRMGEAGVSPTTTEMALFELLKIARGDKFKQISNIVK